MDVDVNLPSRICRLCLNMFFVFLASLFVIVHASEKAPLIHLNDGGLMPGFGLGTWLGFGKEEDFAEAQKAVEEAVDAGYRHVDTAYIYFTEKQVGRAVRKKIDEGVIRREDVFITTKLWNDHHAKNEVVPALKESLDKLNLTYVDLYLIHWPISTNKTDYVTDVDYLETWEGMVEAKKLGLAKSIGICNFNRQQLERLLNHSTVPPAVLQVEINLNLQQPELLAFAREHDIQVMAYTPFGSLFGSRFKRVGPPPPRATDSALVNIAKKYNKTVPQVALRYLHELGVVPIPKSLHKKRIEENIQIFDFQLSPEERKLLQSYDKGFRSIVLPFWKDSPYYPFEE